MNPVKWFEDVREIKENEEDKNASNVIVHQKKISEQREKTSEEL